MQLQGVSNTRIDREVCRLAEEAGLLFQGTCQDDGFQRVVASCRRFLKTGEVIEFDGARWRYLIG